MTDTPANPKSAPGQKILIAVVSAYAGLCTLCFFVFEATRPSLAMALLIFVAIGFACPAIGGIWQFVKQHPFRGQSPGRMCLDTAKWLLELVWTAAIWIWAAAFISTFLSGVFMMAGDQTALPRIRAPLGYVGGISVDQSGKIYARVNLHGRIQVYDSDGEFLHGWFVPTWRGINATYQQIIDQDGNLHVEVRRIEKYPILRELDPKTYLGRKAYNVYTPVGELLEEHSTKFEYEETPRPLTAEDSEGNVYSIRHSFFLPEIVRTTPSGQTQVVVSDPAYLKFVNFPFPGMVGLFGITFGYAAWRQWRKKRGNSAPDCQD